MALPLETRLWTNGPTIREILWGGEEEGIRDNGTFVPENIVIRAPGESGHPSSRIEGPLKLSTRCGRHKDLGGADARFTCDGRIG
ncbi:hypothetical protein DPEC_G00065920 [Dallia pectoralis]|uniref:Uncharacterized protein n=1 Tax=Dallia pectoralis TaxID=75939 RepID=A0ACC2H8K4_DALPE|nr:hypothetical protein DPEC_G00065920 [Dallia pectoralis]